MNVTEAIFARRAVRAYEPRKVESDTIDTLVRAAIQAPSAMNRQPWLFAVIQNAIQLKRYSDRVKAMLLDQSPSDPKISRYTEMLRDPTLSIFYGARTLIVIGAAERSSFTEANSWLAAANLMLAAPESGLGSC